MFNPRINTTLLRVDTKSCRILSNWHPVSFVLLHWPVTKLLHNAHNTAPFFVVEKTYLSKLPKCDPGCKFLAMFLKNVQSESTYNTSLHNENFQIFWSLFNLSTFILFFWWGLPLATLSTFGNNFSSILCGIVCEEFPVKFGEFA